MKLLESSSAGSTWYIARTCSTPYSKLALYKLAAAYHHAPGPHGSDTSRTYYTYKKHVHNVGTGGHRATRNSERVNRDRRLPSKRRPSCCRPNYATACQELQRVRQREDGARVWVWQSEEMDTIENATQTDPRMPTAKIRGVGAGGVVLQIRQYAARQ